MNRPFLSAVSFLAGMALSQASALAQPDVPNAQTRTPSFSIAELEKFLGGRTLISLDLKDATLEEVATALSQAMGQKVETRPPFVPPISLPFPRVAGAPTTAPAPARTVSLPPAPRFSLSASDSPLWPTLRKWQLEARRTSEQAARASNANKVSFDDFNVPNSIGLRRNGQGYLLQAENTMAPGCGVEAWPFLLVATDLRRSQEAVLSEEGLREIASPPPRLPLRLGTPADLAKETAAQAPAAQAPAAQAPAAKEPTPEEQRWLDRLVLSTQIYIDPKLLRPVDFRCEIEEAIDDKGNDLRLGEDEVLSRSGGSGSSYSGMGASMSLPISLRARPNLGKRLVRLRGVLRFKVVSRSQHWETTQLQTPVEDTIKEMGGEFKVKFEGLEKQGNSWGVNFSAQSRGAHLERFWNDRMNSRGRSRVPGGMSGILSFEGVPRMRLVDEAGNVFEGSTAGASMQLSRSNPAPNDPTPSAAMLDISPVPPDAAQNWTYEEKRGFGFGAGSSFRFDGNLSPATGSGSGVYMRTATVSAGTTVLTPSGVQAPAIGQPVKLIVDFPIEHREVSVPFEFTDLPLPPT